jgi:hypothetical protein
MCAQQEKDDKAEGTRQLYYLATPEKDTPPPPLPKPAANTPAQMSSNSLPGALHLGLRYNVVLIGKEGKASPVTLEHVFREGDCFAVDLQANRTAYLYVLAKQSSGAWTPFPDMPGQQQALPQRNKVRIPEGSCFAVHNPPGTETLFIVLSREPRDFYELYSGIKGSETQAASAKVNAAVEHLDEKFGGTRDITIARVSEPTREDEPRGAVYVVNTSKNPTTTLVTKIQIHHK